MPRLRKISLIALSLAVFGIANADTLDMRGASAGSADARPTRGMSQAKVESKYGSPVSVQAATAAGTTAQSARPLPN